MSVLTFEEVIKVKLDGKHIGDIHVVPGPKNPHTSSHGYQYFPKGKGLDFAGQIYPTLYLVKHSLAT